MLSEFNEEKDLNSAKRMYNMSIYYYVYRTEYFEMIEPY